MHSCAVLNASLGQTSPLCVARPGVRHCILGLIGQMAGCEAPGVSAGTSFAVAAGDLAALGCGATMKKARKTQAAQVFRGGDGSFASLASTRFAGLVVRVVAAERALDESVLAAPLLTNTFFTLPREGTHCWHAVRVFLRARMMRGPESACERWGSLMHSLWDGVAGWSPHRIVSRLFVREAGLRGAPQDVAVVREIALALRDREGMDPFVKGAAGSSGQAGVSASCPADLVVRRGLNCGISRENLREQSCPSDLLEYGRAALVRQGAEEARGHWRLCLSSCRMRGQQRVPEQGRLFATA